MDLSKLYVALAAAGLKLGRFYRANPSLTAEEQRPRPGYVIMHRRDGTVWVTHAGPGASVALPKYRDALLAQGVRCAIGPHPLNRKNPVVVVER